MILFSSICFVYIMAIIFSFTYWQKTDRYKYRKRWNLFFGWWLMIPLSWIIMARYRIRYFDKYKPKLAKEFTRTFGLGVNFPQL